MMQFSNHAFYQFLLRQTPRHLYMILYIKHIAARSQPQHGIYEISLNRRLDLCQSSVYFCDIGRQEIYMHCRIYLFQFIKMKIFQVILFFFIPKILSSFSIKGCNNVKKSNPFRFICYSGYFLYNDNLKLILVSYLKKRKEIFFVWGLV